MNDNDRSEWMDNDEGLYRWWKQSGLSKRAFIRKNRGKIDGVITAITNGKKPAHYLAYH